MKRRLYFIYLRFIYRHQMRLSHYFGWHYAPLRGPVEPDGDMYRWCQWCGMRDIVPNERKLIAELNAAAYGCDAASSRPNEEKPSSAARRTTTARIRATTGVKRDDPEGESASIAGGWRWL